MKQILKKKLRILWTEILSPTICYLFAKIIWDPGDPSLELKMIWLFQKAGVIGPAEEMMQPVQMDGSLLNRKIVPEEKCCVGNAGADDTVPSVEEDGGCYEVSQGGGEDPPFAEEMEAIAPPTECYRYNQFGMFNTF